MTFKYRRYLSEKYFLSILLITTFLLHIPYFTDSFVGEDETIYLANANLLLGEKGLYDEIIHGKGPFVIYFFAFLSSTFENSITVLRMSTAFVNSLSSVLIYYISKKMGNNIVGMCSSIIYSISIVHPAFNGFYGMTDPYMNIFCLLSLFLILFRGEKNEYYFIFLSGISICFAFLSKQVSVVFIPTLVLVLIHFDVSKKIDISKTIRYCAILLAGFLAILIPVCLFFYYQNSFDEMFEQIITNWLFRASGDYQANKVGNFFGLYSVFSTVPALLFLGSSYIIHSLYHIFLEFNTNKSTSSVNSNNLSFGQRISNIYIANRIEFICLFWSLSIFLFTIISIQFRNQYSLFLLPPISICAGFSLKKLFDTIIYLKNRDLFASNLLVCLIALILIFPIPAGYISEFLGEESLVSRGSDIKSVGVFINQNTEDGDLIYVFSGPRTIYYYSERESPSIYFKNLNDYRYSSDADQINQTLLFDLQSQRLEFIIAWEDDTVPIMNNSLEKYIKFQDVTMYISKNFVISKTFEIEGLTLNLWIYKENNDE